MKKTCSNCFLVIYHPVNQHSNGKSQLIICKSTINGPFSIAMSTFNRGITMFHKGKLNISIAMFQSYVTKNDKTCNFLQFGNKNGKFRDLWWLMQQIYRNDLAFKNRSPPMVGPRHVWAGDKRSMEVRPATADTTCTERCYRAGYVRIAVENGWKYGTFIVDDSWCTSKKMMICWW